MTTAVLFDTETTGLIDNRSQPSSRQPEIIELYGCLADLDDGSVLDEIELLIKPSVLPLPERTVKITGIRDADLEDKLPFRHHADKIGGFLTQAPLVIAHNASFDRDAVEIEMERLGKTVAWPRLICTVEQTVHLRGFRLGLGDLHECLLGRTFADAHRARTDVAALLRCCVELRKRGDL